ncbi:Mgm101p-domain-containing protein [Rhizodiscina lignyota]|uniref:Mitochondrial genome maintenance protein MGM101 n=1 Tax=Rhizodiscina lignyota TaxID=1504668 RepID=A0A9P4IE33_9PEZI|nr:Mgm101p-domain-containing protein [Rhizodiscina lignyota]
MALTNHPATDISPKPASTYKANKSTTSSSRPASTASSVASKPANNVARSSPSTASNSTSSNSSPAPPRPPPLKTKENSRNSSIPVSDLTLGLADTPPLPTSESSPDAPFLTPSTSSSNAVDWTRSFHGLSTQPFSEEAQRILQEPLKEEDIEIKPDGLAYLPEIKYRRILNRAFGPGGWGLAPRGETLVTGRSVTREYGLVVHGRLVSIARGEQQYFDPEGIPTATEGCKSNALMRCCKDLGVASELWDPVFLRKFMAQHAREVWVEHVTTKKKRKITTKKSIGGGVAYPYKEVKGP